MAILEVSNIGKTFHLQDSDHKTALTDVSFSLGKGNILCFLGPSGCGKTTLLRIIAGLETADRGTVIFDGTNMERLVPHRRQFGMMFQDFALFPHKNVFDNIAFGLCMQKQPRAKIERRIKEVLALVGLEEFENRSMRELSGGERQRVALARSLAPNPRLLMLDEPLGSLDRALRERLASDMRDILKKLDTTTIFVTHDQAEAFAIADLIAVFREGHIEQIDVPENLYMKPVRPSVARFLGFSNLIDGTVGDKGILTETGQFFPCNNGFSNGEKITVLFRPESARLVREDSRNPDVISGTVLERVFQGKNYRLKIMTNSGHDLVFDISNETPPPGKGESVRLSLNPSAVVFMRNMFS